MSATATRHADLRIIRVNPEELHAQVGAGFYREFTFRTSTLMARARKSVLIARPGYGKSRIAAGVAVQLAEGGPITVVSSPVRRAMLDTELREAGYDRPVVVHSPHKLVHDASPLNGNGVLLVCLHSLVASGAPHVAHKLVAQAAADTSRVVMFGTPTAAEIDFINTLSTVCDDITVVNGG